MLAAARRCFFSIQFHGESLGLCVGGAFAFFQFDMAGGGRGGLLLFFLFFFFQKQIQGEEAGFRVCWRWLLFQFDTRGPAVGGGSGFFVFFSISEWMGLFVRREVRRGEEENFTRGFSMGFDGAPVVFVRLFLLRFARCTLHKGIIVLLSSSVGRPIYSFAILILMCMYLCKVLR